MREIAAAQISEVVPLLRGPHIELVVAAIIAGNSAARCWQSEGCVLLWDQANNVLYLAGDHVSTEAQRALSDLVTTTIKPQSLVADRQWFKARALTTSLNDQLPALLPDLNLAPYPMLFWQRSSAQPPRITPPSIPGIEFVQLDRSVLLGSTIANLDPVRSEIGQMWWSEERSLTHGFGWLAVLNQRAIGWCTAEYVSADRCALGIETVQPYEGHGVATALAAHMVQESVQRGLAPYWECSRANAGSVCVAQKVGFQQIAEEPFWVGRFVQ